MPKINKMLEFYEKNKILDLYNSKSVSARLKSLIQFCETNNIPIIYETIAFGLGLSVTQLTKLRIYNTYGQKTSAVVEQYITMLQINDYENVCSRELPSATYQFRGSALYGMVAKNSIDISTEVGQKSTEELLEEISKQKNPND